MEVTISIQHIGNCSLTVSFPSTVWTGYVYGTPGEHCHFSCYVGIW